MLHIVSRHQLTRGFYLHLSRSSNSLITAAMTTSNFEGLADELILQICSYLDQPALAALSLANQRYRRIAQEILYKTPSLIPVEVERYAYCQSVYSF